MERGQWWRTPKHKQCLGALGIILMLLIKSHNQLSPEKLRGLPRSGPGLDSWLRFLFMEAVWMVSEWSVTRQPSPTTVALQVSLEETKAPFLWAQGPEGWWRAGRKGSRVDGLDKGGSKEGEGGVGRSPGQGTQVQHQVPFGSWTLQTANDFGRGKGQNQGQL